MLDMKPQCERCATIFREDDVAYICSYECTFCENCTRWFQDRCPNCGGELMKRPRRVVATGVI